MNRLVCFTVLLLHVSTLQAQQFGGNPPSHKWRQIDTDTVRVIFPAGADTTAYRVTALVHDLARKDYNPLGGKRRKVDIVLQNLTVSSNGYAGLGPFRSEFYLTPPPDNFDQGNVRWADQLALHEYRHVQQFNGFNKGVSKVIGTLFGEEGLALSINAAVPNWFFEGDAVYQETAFSGQGRGRLNAFMRAYPALWKDDKRYSWMKLRNGSLKDYVPDHYNLGYLLVNYGYATYGPGFWKAVTSDAVAYKGVFYPFQKAVKQHAGISYEQFRNDAFAYYKEKYSALKEDRTENDAVLPVNDNTLTHYYFPQAADSGTVVYLKASNKERAGFYTLQNGQERLIRLRDISNERQFSYKNGRIVYAAAETDARWGWKTYSVLKVLDVQSGTQRRITGKTRYFSPDITADGKRIVANKVDLQGRSSLVVLSNEGRILKELAIPGIDYFSTPKFINDHQVIAAVRTGDATTFIGLIDLNTNRIEHLTPATAGTIGQLNLNENKIYFIASDGLKDQVFSVAIDNGQLQRLNRTGPFSYYAGAGHGKIIWSDFTADGFQLRERNAGPEDWTLVTKEDFTRGISGVFEGPVLQQEDAAAAPATAALPSVRKYGLLTRPFNLHSWRPNYADPEYSFSVYGNNVLNTTETELYYLYNENDKTSAVGGRLTYGGLFPYLGIGAQYTFDRKQLVQNRIRTWDQSDNYLSAVIPLSWIKGRNYWFVTATTNLGYRKDFLKGPDSGKFPAYSFGYLTHGLVLGTQVQRTVQDIYPRWGATVHTQYRYAVNRWTSKQLYGKLTLFLPGIAFSHSLVVTAGVQESSTHTRLFGNRINFARGFSGVDSARIGTGTATYHLPLVYPDWGFGNLFYLQRVRGAAFYDYTAIRGKAVPVNRDLESAGMEVYLDTRWWNQYAVTFGFRSGRLLTRDLVVPGRKWFYEFILPVSLIPR